MSISHQKSKTPTNKLIILSIPLQRIIRSHLSPEVIEILVRSSDLIIVSPFTNNASFVNRYNHPRIKHINIENIRSLNWLQRKAIAISTILRVRGYWFKRKKEIPYYWATRHASFSENGYKIHYEPFKQYLIDLLSRIGSWEYAWRLFDYIHGRITYKCTEIITATKKYDEVIVIQASSWCYQDAALAFHSRKNKWKSLFVPYTTDQLFCNGYLLNNYKVIYVQGHAEERFVKQYHSTKNSIIIKLGSLYSKRLKDLCKKNLLRKKVEDKISILFAGSINNYFPTKSEFQILRMVIELISSEYSGYGKITYRPIANSSEIKKEILENFSKIPNLDIEFADPALYSLEEYSDIDMDFSLKKHIKNISQHDLLITLGCTSLSLDCAFLNVPSLAIYFDLNGHFENTKQNLLFNSDNQIIGFEPIPVAKNLKDLNVKILEILHNKVYAQSICDDLKLDWDHNPENFIELINFGINGKI